MAYEAADLERRLEAGEWLPIGAVAVLLGQGRTSVHRLATSGGIKYRRTLGGQRRCDPEDVRRLLAEARKIHGTDEAAEPQPPAAAE